MNQSLPQLLHDLKHHLLVLSSTVEDAVAKVVQALVQRDSRLAREVVAADAEIDNMEVRIEGHSYASGTGKSKKEAEQHAAQVTLEQLRSAARR